MTTLEINGGWKLTDSQKEVINKLKGNKFLIRYMPSKHTTPMFTHFHVPSKELVNKINTKINTDSKGLRGYYVEVRCTD